MENTLENLQKRLQDLSVEFSKQMTNLLAEYPMLSDIDLEQIRYNAPSGKLNVMQIRVKATL